MVEEIKISSSPSLLLHKSSAVEDKIYLSPVSQDEEEEIEEPEEDVDLGEDEDLEASSEDWDEEIE